MKRYLAREAKRQKELAKELERQKEIEIRYSALKKCVCDKLDALEAEAGELEKAYKQFYESTVRQIETLLPRLTRDASKEECLGAVKEFSARFYAYLDQISGLRQQMKENKASFERKKCESVASLENSINNLRDSDMTNAKERREVLNTPNEDSFYDKSLGSKDVELLDCFVHTIMEGKSEEARSCVLGDHNPFSAHLHKRDSSRAVLQFSPKQAFSGSHLPVEIATMVYSYCDLETSCVLRRVSTQWYYAFHECERVFEHKLNDRCPSLYPEGHLKSWADCVLVFVNRLKNINWRKRKDFRSKMHNIDETVPKQLPAMKLNHHVPEDFEPLQSRAISDDKYSCSRNTETELEYQGLKLTFLFHDIVTSVDVYRDKVMATCTTKIYTFDRSKPLHYKNATKETIPDIVSSYQFGKCVMRKRTVGKYEQHEIYNPHSKTYTPFGLAKYYKEMIPVAVRHGIVWWVAFHSQNRLLPTFIDTQARDTVYCNFQRVLEVARQRTHCDLYDNNRMEPFKQCGNLVYNWPSTVKNEKFQVADLDSGELTWIHPPGGICDKKEYLVGYLHGKFHAMYWDNNTQAEFGSETKEKICQFEQVFGYAYH